MLGLSDLSPQAIVAIGGVITAGGAASYKLIKLVLSALREQRQEFTAFLGNHMSENTRALERVSERLDYLAREVGRHADRER
jgi:hypothetical protein